MNRRQAATRGGALETRAARHSWLAKSGRPRSNRRHPLGKLSGPSRGKDSHARWTLRRQARRSWLQPMTLLRERGVGDTDLVARLAR